MSVQHSRFSVAPLRAAALGLAVLAGCSGSGPGAAASRTPAPATEQNPKSAAAAATGTSPPAPVSDPPRLLTEAELADGWISLFDGHSLFGWKSTSHANWSVKDGVVLVDEGEKGLLCTTTVFADYTLKADFRAAQDTNSGFFLHTTLSPSDPAKDCYEVNIAPPDNPYPTGSLVQRQKADKPFDSREWQTCEITVAGPRIAVRLDDQPAVVYQDPRPLCRGHIGLQFNEGRVEFRNIKLKPLGLGSLYDGRSLTGWKPYPQMAAKYTVAQDGTLHVQGGRGQLETEGVYADFALQFECLTHAAEVNSGIFFRCLPGKEMMGYEAQIHNGYKDHDRSQPTDCGTGGIFARQPARRVMADDQKWFHETLIAHGLHVAVWVEGYQVTDWVDQRPPHDNPRKGLRLEAGTIMIQGHDQVTDLSFRQLRAVELATRQE